MNRSALERAVARATGESRRTIRRFGFSLLPEDTATEDIAQLGLDCPGCGAEIALPTQGSDFPEFAECPRCDAAYPYHADELFVAECSDEALAACA
jgi:hypothetical protein